jgi:hypothetical protein
MKAGDVGIVEFIRERVADVLRACRGRVAGVSRACRGHVALLDNINVSDISREFLAMSNLFPLVSTFTRIV